MPPSLIVESLLNAAENQPGAIALSCVRETLDYRTLAERVRRAAGWLRDGRTRAGDRIAVWGPKSCDQVVMLLAALATGRVAVPVNPLLRTAQVRHILDDAGVRWLFAEADRATALGAPPPGGWQVASLDAAVAHPRQAALHARAPDELAALFYTSGSTGQPKGVMITQANLAHGAASVVDYLGLGAADRLLGVLPLSFDYGFSQLTTALTAGASVHLLDYLLPRDIEKTVRKRQITVLAGVPGLLIPLARQDWLGELSSLRLITNSGGSLPLDTVRALRKALPDAGLVLMYGLTEAFRSTWLAPSEVDEHPTSIGRPIPGATVRVLRPDGSICQPGESGELVHGGPLVGAGYWNAPQATNERFRPPPPGWPEPQQGHVVYSGDRVRMDRDGRLYFEGRFDAQIKTAGYRVSPEEIETVASGHPPVREALVHGEPDGVLGQRIVLTVAPETVDPQELHRYLAGQLPRYMLPARIERLAALPRSPNGKLDRRALQQPTSGNCSP
ncbi:MAG: AMP-binding protein [Halothiobacillaceae bacterium]